MVYDFEGLPKRFMEARKNKGVSRETLGKFVGNTRQAVARWEQPVGHERHSVPDLPTIAQVAAYLGVDFLWLLTGKNFTEAVNEGGGDLVPVFGIQELHAKATPKLYRRTLQNLSSEARGWFIGDVHDNIPEYLPPDFCVIDPAVKPAPGKMAVFRIVRWNRNLFRRYTVDGYLPNGQPRIVLEALNPAVKPTVIDDQNPCQVIGTLVSHERNMLLR